MFILKILRQYFEKEVDTSSKLYKFTYKSEVLYTHVIKVLEKWNFRYKKLIVLKNDSHNDNNNQSQKFLC